RYAEKVKMEFASDPVSQFVQQLRNYMVHRGLPNSEMFLDMEQDPSTGQGATIRTGVRLEARSLLEWDGWNATAKSYIDESGTYVDIRAFAAQYQERVAGFQEWLQKELDQHHQLELRELDHLRNEFSKLERNAVVSTPPRVQPRQSTGDVSG